MQRLLISETVLLWVDNPEDQEVNLDYLNKKVVKKILIIHLEYPSLKMLLQTIINLDFNL